MTLAVPLLNALVDIFDMIDNFIKCVYIYHILIGRLWPLLFLGDLEFRAYSHGPHTLN